MDQSGPGPDRLADQIAEASRRLELHDPDEGQPFLDRLVNRAVEALGVVVLSTIVGTIFSNAVARYLFNVSFIWAEELVLLLVPWLAMTGVFLSVRRGTMIRIEFFFDKLAPKRRAVAADLGTLASVAVLAFMGWVSIDFLLLFGGDTSPYLDVATGLSSSALVFGAFGGALAFMVALHRERRRRRSGGRS